MNIQNNREMARKCNPPAINRRTDKGNVAHTDDGRLFIYKANEILLFMT